MPGAQQPQDTMPPSLRAHAGLLFAGLASFIVMGAGQSIYGPALPAFSRNFGIGLAEAALIVSAHWVGCGVGVATLFWRPDTPPRAGLASMTLGAALVAAGLGWTLTLAGAAVFVAFLGVRLALVAGAGLLAPFTLFTAALGIAGVAGAGAVLVSPALFFVTMGAAAGLFFPAFYVCATARMGNDSRVAPTIVASGLVGGIAAPPILGAVLAWGGGAGFFATAAALALGATGAALVLRPAINRRHAA